MPGLQEGLGLLWPTQQSPQPSKGPCCLLPPRPRFLARSRANTEQLKCANLLEDRKALDKGQGYSFIISIFFMWEMGCRDCRQALNTREELDTKLDPRVSISPSHKRTQVASFLLELIEEEMESHRHLVTCQRLGTSTELSQSSQTIVCTLMPTSLFKTPLCVCVCVCMCVCSVTQSCPTLVTPWTVAHQASLSMGFPGKNTGVDSHFHSIQNP